MNGIWTQAANADLENIFAFIAEDNFDAACQIDSLLRNSARKLRQFPY
ncbi:MAG: type II toxin-antitoxin system RelE/ParE family toxin [Desulfovibrionaceae bacterium]|nr:type II toxin-antitoxin system RelE/ParE family toxin [Desulfovibrionaceae bacterium]